MGIGTYVLLALSLLAVAETRCPHQKNYGKNSRYHNGAQKYDDRWSPNYKDRRGPSYDDRKGPTYNRRDSTYDRQDPSYDRRDPSYVRRDLTYNRRDPTYDRRNPTYNDRRGPTYNKRRTPTYDSPRKERHSPSLGYVIAKMARFISKKFNEIDFRLDDLRQINSCSGRCTEEIPGATCQCHNNCGVEENCCSDFVYECDRSCEDICDTAFDDRYACQCDSACDVYINCCLNYKELCATENTNTKHDWKSLKVNDSKGEPEHPHPFGDNPSHEHDLYTPTGDASEHLIPDEDLSNPISGDSLESEHLIPDNDLSNPQGDDSLESEHLNTDENLSNSPSDDSLESAHLIVDHETSNTSVDESLESEHLIVDYETSNTSTDESLESEHLYGDGEGLVPQQDEIPQANAIPDEFSEDDSSLGRLT